MHEVPAIYTSSADTAVKLLCIFAASTSTPLQAKRRAWLFEAFQGTGTNEELPFKDA